GIGRAGSALASLSLGRQGLLHLRGFSQTVRENLRASHRGSAGTLPRRSHPGGGKTLHPRPLVSTRLQRFGRSLPCRRSQGCGVNQHNENKILVAARITATKMVIGHLGLSVNG